nr:hypothetical protein [Sorangium cellulosum]
MSSRDRRLLSPVGDGRSPPLPGDPPAGRSGGGASKPIGPILTAQHALTLLPGMEAVLGSIFRDVERAERRVDIETYIYRDDLLGSAFADVMGRAAARGGRARLLYDPLGSHETDAPFFDALRRRDIEVRAYRPMAPGLGHGGLLPRDHSRVIVIDDQAYTGGAAWGDEWLPERRGGKGWHDVCLRLEGPCVEDFAFLFERRWREADGGSEGVRDYATGRKYPDLELVADTPDDNARVYARYREAIRRARERVWIENAYFFPPAGMLKDLVDAAARRRRPDHPPRRDRSADHQARRARRARRVARSRLHDLRVPAGCPALEVRAGRRRLVHDRHVQREPEQPERRQRGEPLRVRSGVRRAGGGPVLAGQGRLAAGDPGRARGAVAPGQGRRLARSRGLEPPRQAG